MIKNTIILAGNDDRLKKTISLILRKESFSVLLINDIPEIVQHIQHYKQEEDTIYLLLFILPLNDQKSIETLVRLQKKIMDLSIIIIHEFLDNLKIKNIKHELQCTLLEKSFDAGALIETVSSVFMSNKKMTAKRQSRRKYNKFV